jgi:hypothetical protein
VKETYFNLYVFALCANVSYLIKELKMALVFQYIVKECYPNNHMVA